MPEFNMVALGDSVVWGQGLREADKFSSLVATTFGQQIGRKLGRFHRLAHSGPGIGESGDSWTGNLSFDVGSLKGELPQDMPTVFGQVEYIKSNAGISPQDVDVVLLNGGINDYFDGDSSLLWLIVDPRTSIGTLRSVTRRICYERMRGLLFELLRVCPNALVVVCGYYPIFSNLSLLGQALMYVSIQLKAVGVPEDEIGDFPNPMEKLASLSFEWSSCSSSALSEAVQEVNESLSPALARCAFSAPSFAAEHCLFAPDSLLWGIGPVAGGFDARNFEEALNWLDQQNPYTPQDPLSADRRVLCASKNPAYEIQCQWASVGHPNAMGARQYCNAISPVLRKLWLDNKKIEKYAGWVQMLLVD